MRGLNGRAGSHKYDPGFISPRSISVASARTAFLPLTSSILFFLVLLAPLLAPIDYHCLLAAPCVLIAHMGQGGSSLDGVAERRCPGPRCA